MAASLSYAASQLKASARSVTTTSPFPNSRFLKSRIVAIRRSHPVTASLSTALPNGRVRTQVKSDEKPIIVIDNYDSFTYNLCQAEKYKFTHEPFPLLHPASGAPRDSGISLQAVLELGPTIPIFGVCMGLQCIGEAFGGKIVRAPTGVVHGKGSPVHYDEKMEHSLFQGLTNPFKAGRYHSLVIEYETFPHDALEITAWSEDGLVMAARHRKYKHILGVQFHPESIITTDGKKIVLNFMNFVKQLQLKPPENEN